MKIPRDISAQQLIQSLQKIGYQVTRQKGSHIRLTAIIDSNEHHITVPNHAPLKIGTLNNILNEIADHNKISKEKIVNALFGQ